MQRAAWIAVGALLVLLAYGPSRNALLLQDELGATIPFLGFLVLSLAPLAVSLWARRAQDPPAWLARVRGVHGGCVLWALLFALITIESFIDPAWTRLLGYDLTPYVRDLEGDAVARVQSSLRQGVIGRVLDLVGSAVYSYGYVMVYPGVVAISLLRSDAYLARPLLRSYLLIWTVGLPCYLFLPVNEPWFGSATVVNVMHTTIPPSAQNPLLAYNINNELPSLHSALSVACAYVLVQRRAWGWLAATGWASLSLPFFVVYLGIHWVTDAVTGVALGLACAWLATRGDAPGKAEIPPPLFAPDGERRNVEP